MSGWAKKMSMNKKWYIYALYKVTGMVIIYPRIHLEQKSRVDPG